MKAFSLILVATASLLLAACTTNLEQLRERQKGEGEETFNSALAREYTNFAQSEADQYDWPDSEHFARKAIATLEAGEGVIIEPELPETWDIPEEYQHQVANARENLMEILPIARDKFPMKAAHAQALYDCWLEQQEENWQEEDIATCRTDFFAALRHLEDECKMKPEEEQAMQPKEESTPSVEGKHSTVYFGFNKTTLTKRAKAVLRDLVATLKEKSGYKLHLEGHADRSGKETYNLKLSEKRAEAVQKELIKQGVDGSAIVQSFGESLPKVPTKDGVPNPENRRVEIIVTE